jgi:hypothetical protein
VILSVVDLRVLLAHGAADHPESPIRCRACTLPCRGPWQVEAEGVPDPPLAFLAYKVGAPLEAHLCVTCGRVLLALDARDLEGRRALAKHFPDVGGCDRCGRGRLRLTHVDVPYAGRVVLSGPGPSELAAAVCDGCGEASLRVAAARDGL